MTSQLPTLISASWENADSSLALVNTGERGLVMVSPDRPELWQWLQDAIANGLVVQAYTPQALAANDYAHAIQRHIETTAKARGYLDAVTCASYYASTISTWQTDALAFIAWRDSVWTYAYAQLAAVQAGQRAAPTIQGLVSELPPIAWSS